MERRFKRKIYKAFSKSDSLAGFENELNKLNVTVKKRKSSYTKDDGTKAKRDAYTYYFVDQKGKQRRIKDFSYRRGQPSGLGKSFTPESIEREYENAKNITRQQFQEDANKSIEEYSEQFEQSNGINSENISTGTRENGTGTARENSRTSEARSTERVFENVDTERLGRFEREFAKSDRSTDAINKLIKFYKDGKRRKPENIQLFKPNLQAAAEIEQRLLKNDKQNVQKINENLSNTNDTITTFIKVMAGILTALDPTLMSLTKQDLDTIYNQMKKTKQEQEKQ